MCKSCGDSTHLVPEPEPATEEPKPKKKRIRIRTEKDRAGNRERNRKRRSERRAKGVCTECESPVEGTSWLCPVCKDKDLKWRQKVIESSNEVKCVKCMRRNDDPTYKTCPECRRKGREASAKRKSLLPTPEVSIRMSKGECPVKKKARDERKKVSKKNKYYRRKEEGRCPTCGEYAPFGYTLCTGCASKAVERKDLAVINGKCVRCPNTAVEGKQQCQDCLDKQSVRNAKLYQELKDKVYAAYGGYECKWCGEKDADCLQLDHIKDDGHVHREEIGGSGEILFRDLIERNFPPIVQVLCANCNWRKRAMKNRGELPQSSTENELCLTT